LGSWVKLKNAHQSTEWNLDARKMSMYRYHEDIWTKQRAVNYGRLRFELTGAETTEPSHITHKADGTQRRQKNELNRIHAVQTQEIERGNDPVDSIYTS
jgi:hypothetical protein